MVPPLVWWHEERKPTKPPKRSLFFFPWCRPRNYRDKKIQQSHRPRLRLHAWLKTTGEQTNRTETNTACNNTPVCPRGPAIHAIITLNRSVCLSSLQPYCDRKSKHAGAGMLTDQIAALRHSFNLTLVCEHGSYFLFCTDPEIIKSSRRLASGKAEKAGGNPSLPIPSSPLHSTPHKQSRLRACRRKAGKQLQASGGTGLVYSLDWTESVWIKRDTV